MYVADPWALRLPNMASPILVKYGQRFVGGISWVLIIRAKVPVLG